MGFIRHHAIVVTGWNADHLKDARISAIKLFGHLVSEIIQSKVNDYASFFISPDGSKEGWDHSDNFDSCRKQFTQELEASPNLYVDWAEVSFGGDDKDNAKLINHSKYGEEED